MLILVYANVFSTHIQSIQSPLRTEISTIDSLRFVRDVESLNMSQMKVKLDAVFHLNNLRVAVDLYNY